METEELLKKRFEDLAMNSSRSNIFTFTGFLNMAEIAIFHQMKNKISYVGCALYGGREECERLMIRFGSEEVLGYAEKFPIVCVEIAPLMKKFADRFTHRDFLGALMNLGIERTTLGDIMIYENTGYVFCTEVIAPFIIDTLNKVKHTSVRCTIVEAPALIPEAEAEIRKIQIASERIDGVVAKVYNLSRGDSLELFRQKKIFLNGMPCENNSRLLKEEDVVTARGFGKFIYQGYENISKKGKKNVIIIIRRI